MMQKVVCLFGNNASLKSWHFFFNIFARGAGLNTELDRVGVSTCSRKTYTVKSSFLREINGIGFHEDVRAGASSIHEAQFPRRTRVSRSIRADY
jgi:hypothetical protein